MIPKNMTEKYDEIAPLITDFCTLKLNAEYQELSIRLLEKLCRKRPSPLLRGRANTWACGIVYVIGSNNFLFDKSQEPHMTAAVLAEGFGVSASTAGNKAAEIRSIFNISPLDPEWTLRSRIEENPMFWMLKVDGYIVDIRRMPLEIQQQAFEQGMIPFIPKKKPE